MSKSQKGGSIFQKRYQNRLVFFVIFELFLINKQKTMRYYITILFISAVIVFQSCDDSGFVPSDLPKGTIIFRQKNLMHIDPNIDGVFELWIRLDSAGSIKHYSLGRFNINQNGEITDTLGGSIEFKFKGDTNNLYQTTRAFVTVEPPGDYNSEPSSSVLMSGQTYFKFDSIYAHMTFNDQEALGTAGSFIVVPFSYYASYIVGTPTALSQNCTRGIWMCSDSIGNSDFPPQALITSPGWVYEFWVQDKSNPLNPVYFSAGKYKDPLGPDFDGAGPCSGPEVPYSKPGQDWVTDTCIGGKPQNLNNGNYSVFITLEPSLEQYGTSAYNLPFFLKLYKKETVDEFCYRRGKMVSIASNNNLIPDATLKILYH